MPRLRLAPFRAHPRSRAAVAELGVVRRLSTRSVNRGYNALLLGIAAIAILVVGRVGYVLGPRLYYMKSEYVTADVIRAADRFVTEHPKKWPQSWQDLGGEDLSRYTDFRFDLTPEMIVRDRQLIYSAIQPKCHQYRTYPHARAQLDGLYEKLTSVPSRQ